MGATFPELESDTPLLLPAAGYAHSPEIYFGSTNERSYGTCRMSIIERAGNLELELCIGALQCMGLLASTFPQLLSDSNEHSRAY